MYKTKRQQLVALVLALCMICSLFAGLQISAHAEGLDLTAEEIVIDSVEDFLEICDAANFATIKTKTIKLAADIDMIDQDAIAPIGGTTAFEGVFDGQGHIIKNLEIAGTGNATGLFGYVGTSGQIKNLGLDGVRVSGNVNTGAVAGGLSGSVTNCYVRGLITGMRYTGGIAGMLHAGTIENCWVDVDFTGSRYCGGLFGGTTWNTRYDSEPQYHLLTEKITGKPMVVRNNLTLGNVTANRFAAGMLGDMANPKDGQGTTLEAFEGNVAWNTSVTVLANDDKDRYGPVYANWKDRIYNPITAGHQQNLYWEGMTLTGPDPSITQTESQNHEQVNVVSKTKDELSQQATYEDIGWDFENTWTWSNTLGHPVLKVFAEPSSYDPYAQKTPASVVTTFVNSPKTTRAFTWYTDTSVTKTIVQAVAEDNYTDESAFTSANAIIAEGTNYKLEIAADGTSRHIHKAELTGLNAGITYKYRVGDGENWSSVFSFTTEEEDADSFTFFNITDTQDEDDAASSYSRYANTLKYATDAYPEAEFIFHTGDVIQWNSTADYDEVYRVTRKYTTDLPSMITPGNHELDKDEIGASRPFTINYVKGLDNFKSHYQFPDNGPDNGKQIIYSFDYGDAHFVVLDSNNKHVSEADQIEWLKKDLANTDKAWKIVSLHHGPLNASGINSKPMLQALADLEVDLVLFGHYHLYMRSNPIQVDANGNITVGTATNVDGVWQADTEGTVFHSAGCSAGVAGDSSNSYFAVKNNTENDSLYTAITITEDSLTLKTHSVPNNTSATESVLLDAFVITKPAATAVTTVAADEQIYNGKAQSLIKSAETSTEGIVVYSFDGTSYSEILPTATDAGTYFIYYKVAGDADHSDSEVQTVEAVIRPKDISNAQITLGSAPVYDGSEQTQSIVSVVIDGLDVTYDVTGNTGVDVSDAYMLTVTGTGNFTGTATKAWSILEKSTEPTTEPPTEPTTEPTAVPTTEPTTVPTTEPTTEPTTAPTTEPTTAPTTEPTTAPTTEPTTAPTTELTTEVTTAPTTEATTAPSTAPTTKPSGSPDTGDHSGIVLRICLMMFSLSGIVVVLLVKKKYSGKYAS